MFRLLLKEYTNGKKYLCKSEKEDWKEYLGSGNSVKNKDLVLKETTLLGEFETNQELKEMGIYYSDLWDVVNSNTFLNEIREEGQGGYTSYTEERNNKISQALTGKEKTKEHSENISKVKKGLVSYKNIITGETGTISKEAFELDDNLVGINSGGSWKQNITNGHGKRGQCGNSKTAAIGRTPGNAKKFIAEEKEFSSIKEAEVFYNRSRGWIVRRLNDPNNTNFIYKE